MHTAFYIYNNNIYKTVTYLDFYMKYNNDNKVDTQQPQTTLPNDFRIEFMRMQQKCENETDTEKREEKKNQRI